MSQLQTRLTAHARHRAFPTIAAAIQRHVPDLTIDEPDWLLLAEAMRDGDTDLERPLLPTGQVRAPLAEVRVDEGSLNEHIQRLRSFVADFPAWLVSITAPHSGAGVRALPLPLSSAQLTAVLPAVLGRGLDLDWACTWPEATRAALEFTDLDACCEGVDGFVVEVFAGLRPAPDPGPWSGQAAWEAIRTALPLAATVQATVIASGRDGVFVQADPYPAAVAVVDVEGSGTMAPAPGQRIEARVIDHRRDIRQVRLRLLQTLPTA